MTVLSLTVADAQSMREIGQGVIAPRVHAGDLIIVTGELGAGKTTLVQGIGAGLGVRGPVTSPTFIIARTHPSETGGLSLIHADAYRLTSLAELDDLDLDTTLDEAVTVVEWGEGLAEVLSDDRLHVAIHRVRGGDVSEGDGGPRTILLRGVGPSWEARPFSAPQGGAE